MGNIEQHTHGRAVPSSGQRVAVRLRRRHHVRRSAARHAVLEKAVRRSRYESRLPLGVCSIRTYSRQVAAHNANALSYIAVFVALAGIQRSRLVPRAVGSRSRGNLRAAVVHVCQRPDVLRPLTVMAAVGLVALNF